MIYYNVVVTSVPSYKKTEIRPRLTLIMGERAISSINYYVSHSYVACSQAV